MPQRHIIKRVVQRRINIFKRADIPAFRIAGHSADDKLMRQDDVALVRVNPHFPDHGLRRILCVADGLIRKEPAHAVRMDVGHQPEADLAIRIGKRNRLDVPVIHRGNVDISVL